MIIAIIVQALVSLVWQAVQGPLTAGVGVITLALSIGAALHGSGSVLLAFLRADFVIRLGWLTDQQLLDAVLGLLRAALL